MSTLQRHLPILSIAHTPMHTVRSRLRPRARVDRIDCMEDAAAARDGGIASAIDVGSHGMKEHSVDSQPMNTSTMLAFERTRVAYERTMMAWVRTGTSLITFGFSVYKFFEFEMKKGLPFAPMLLGPRGFGLALIGIGLLSLLFGTVAHQRDLRALRQQCPGIRGRSNASLVALVVGGLGLLAMLAAILHM
jgi:inner membrane protein YidH